MPSNSDIPRATPSEIRKVASQFSNFGSDYVFAHVTKTDDFEDFAKHTMRLGGMAMVLCVTGSVDLNVNIEQYHLTDNTLLALGGDCVLKINNVDWQRLDAYVFAMSTEFIRDVNFELNLLATMRISSSQPPLISLTADEVQLITRYFDLIHYNTVSNADARYVRSISRSLIAATVYQLMQFASTRVEAQPAPNLSRRANYVREFLQLVGEHHKRERGVAFYASKLFISPKYLSIIIKESTGRSAAEWIDDYVILEAKNLLRFSGKNVQQVAYELNFSNQSSFGKYFKHFTGMSPTKFQRS